MIDQNDLLADLRNIKLPFNLDEVDEQCHQCVRKQIEKYKKHRDPSGKNMEGRFIVPCTGIPKNPVDPDLLAILPNEETKNEMEEINDVVKWAKANLFDNGKPWKARWYQADALRCTSKRKVLRVSRRAGKTTLICVEICYRLFTEPGIKILVAGPQKTHAEEIFTRVRELIDSNPKLFNMITRNVSGNYYEIKLSNGSRVRGFAAGAKGGSGGISMRGQDADLMCLDEMDYIDENAILGAVYPILQTNADTALIGSSTPSGFRTPYYECCEEDPQYKELHFSYKVLPHWKQVEADKPRFTEEKWTHEFCFAGDQKVLIYNKNKVIEKMIKDVSIGNKVYSSQDKKLVNVTNIFHNSDRRILKVETDIKLIKCTEDHSFRSIDGIKTSICKLDKIPVSYVPNYLYDSTIEERKARLVGFINGDGYIANLKTRYSARFYGKKEDLENIAFDIEKVYGKKYKPCFKSTSKNTDTWTIEVSKDISEDLVLLGALVGNKTKQFNRVPEWIKEKGIEKEFFGGLWGAKGSSFIPVNHTIHSLSLSMTLLSNEILFDFKSFLLKLNIDATIIGNIIYIKSDKDYQKFAEANFVRYNKKKESDCFFYDLFFKERNRLYFNNFKKHRLIYSESLKKEKTLKILLEEYGISKKSYYKWKKNVDNIGYKKYGQISTFIPKAKDWIQDRVSDNLCYIDIIETKLTNESIPTYNIEVDSSDHSYLLTGGIETFNCAEWGDSENGVYKPHYIDTALTSYDYSDNKRIPTWKYCIGTDWNEKHGTELVVLGYDTATNIYKVVEAVLVAGSEFTQLSGIQKLLDLNRKWRPNFIYIDSGNGSTNAELLRKMSHEERRAGGDRDTARLLDIMKRYDAGSSIPVRDPVTGEDIKSPAKPFMVNASVRMFEQKRIKISSADEILEKQIRNYIIERYTPTKSPVYSLNDKKVGDHRLDALNLAIVAFHLEFDKLHTVSYITNVAVAPDPRKSSSEISNREELSFAKNRGPEERRLDADKENNTLNNITMKAIMPAAKLDNGMHKMKTDRRGWDSDTEQKEMQTFLQKKHSRSTVQRNRPKRTTF